MTTPAPLSTSELRRTCDPQLFKFEDTAELDPLEGAVGQERAVEALDFGVRIRREGYNLYVLGPSGSGRHSAVRQHLEKQAAEQPVAPDWCYVNNFGDPHKPRALRLPPGRGAKLRAEMKRLVDELGAAIPAAFESDDYRARKEAVINEVKEKHEQAFEALRRRSAKRNILLVRTPDGLALAPTKDGEVIAAEDFEKLPPEERDQVQADLDELRDELKELVHQAPTWAQQQRERLRDLDRETTSFAVNHLIDALREQYSDLEPVLDYLQAVQDDVLEHANQFMAKDPNPLQAMLGGMPAPASKGTGDFQRYQVNLIVDHSDDRGAPVVHEDQPNHQRLVGRIEHVSQLGALVTDFTLIKPGALHAANGGFLVMDAHKLLSEPFAYDALKRALRARELGIESLAERLSIVSTVSLEPQPIPLEIKVVLIGERLVYYLLCTLDPEFAEMFKVPVDFDDSMTWDDDTPQLLARLVGTFARSKKLRSLERAAVARLVEHAARLTADKEKLTGQISRLLDVVRESDFWADEAGREVVAAVDVQQALDARIRRADRLRERFYEDIRRGTKLIDTVGEQIGQVNGLSVIELGGFGFGIPSRITARVRLGKGNVVDIEREVELGGPIHSKGVLILSGFLGERFASEQPLCLAASLVFEQSYGGVEGDSASSAEAFALLSALSKAPVKQGLAVTGSMNQHGRMQAIGGVNEKIEGFFDICRATGLSGDQGVLIPAANVKHLMLRQDVIDAATKGQFRIYPIDNLDQGIEILTGVPAGTREADGSFTAGSINRRVQDRLAAMAAKVRTFDAPGQSEAAGEKDETA